MAKRFMYVCLGILALALAYHLAKTASANTDSVPFVVFDSDKSEMAIPIIVAPRGDSYYFKGWTPGESWVWLGNVYDTPKHTE